MTSIPSVKAFYPEAGCEGFCRGDKGRTKADVRDASVFRDLYKRIRNLRGGRMHRKQTAQKTNLRLDAPPDKSAVKNDLKQLLYEMLSEEHGGKRCPGGR